MADSSREPSVPLDLPAETQLAEPERKGFWGKLKRGLFMTHTELIERVNAAVSGRDFLDDTTLERLEETLIEADLGVNTALELVERLKEEIKEGEAASPDMLRHRLAHEIGLLLLRAPRRQDPLNVPRVTLVVGVNGVGKTTSIAKLARAGQGQGSKVLLVAADTFRAAAIEQISLWG